ncbi:MAG: hypothetical protein U5N55_02155 [Cypionkella sp.]|nr:hypothetical protein [Cypionkella sp.]
MNTARGAEREEFGKIYYDYITAIALNCAGVAVLADTAGGPELLVEGAGAHETAWRDWADPEPG